ncbi:MAG TPA: hypothetical protein VFD39_02120, partial [Trueperaceae bacterium]|nr:hypothetical protein [Trueperaceae bacterium]
MHLRHVTPGSTVFLFVVAILLASLTACGGPTGPVDPGPPGEPSALEDALDALGVDTAQSDRVDPNGEPLPDDYAPLGAEASLNDVPEFSDESGQNPTLELFVAGPPLDGGTSDAAVVELVGVEVDGEGNVVPGTASILDSLPDEDNAWIDDDSNGAANSGEHRSLRAAAAGDLDGDGLQETVVVYVDVSVAALPLRVKTIEDAETGFAETTDTVADGGDVLGVQLEVADVDGDGASEVVLALSDASGVEIRLLSGAPGSFAIDPNFSYRADAVIASSQVSARLA